MLVDTLSPEPIVLIFWDSYRTKSSRFGVKEDCSSSRTGREREMFYLTTHSTHFIYGYMASDIWLRTILIVRKETRCRHIGYSYRLTARVLLYAPSHRQNNTYHGLCYTSRGALAGTRILQNNAPTHMFTVAMAAIQKCGFQLIEDPLYSPGSLWLLPLPANK